MKALIVLLLTATMLLPTWSTSSTQPSVAQQPTLQQQSDQLADELCHPQSNKCKIVSWNS